MYLGIDIGATKTLIGVFNLDGALVEKKRFLTSKIYDAFISELHLTIDELETKEFQAGVVAAPGRIDRQNGVGLIFGNLPWINIPLQADIESAINAPVTIENDTKVAALFEAKQIINEFKKALYVTISTGISAGLIINGVIDPELADSESGHMLLEHKGKLQTWESFASGKAIVKEYSLEAKDIVDPSAWKSIAHNIAVGLIDLIAVIQPEIIIIGGGVGMHFDKYEKPLLDELKKYEMPLVPIPPIRKAQNAEEAVLYGCYELAKEKYEKLS